MSWSAPFLADLELATAPKWQFFFQAVDLSGLEEVYGGPISVGTHPDLCANVGTDSSGAPLLMMKGPPTIQGSQLSIRDWSTTSGTTTITVCGQWTTAKGRITRGTVIEVKMGKVGQLATLYQRIAIGRVSNISGGPAEWTIELSDMLGILAHRPVAGYSALKVGGVVGAALSADYTAGDTTIKISSISNIDYEAGQDGLAYVVPADGSEAFFVTFTGTASTPDRLTGVAALGTFGTTPISIAVADGADVYDCVYVVDHPINAVRKVWMSTGAGTNGTYDTLPAQWGYGLSQGFFDNDDMDDEVADIVVVAAGNYRASLWSEVNVETPGEWVREFLSAFGCFIAMRQGVITIRGASMATGRKRTPVLTVNDGDIVNGSTVLVSMHDGAKDEAGRVYAYSGTGDDVVDYSVFATAPAVYADVYDMTRWAWSNETRVREELLERVKVYHCRLPETWEVLTAGLRCMQLAVGDFIYVSSSLMVGRLTYGSSYGGVSARVCEVIQVSPDIAANTVRLRFIAWPDDPENDIFQ